MSKTISRPDVSSGGAESPEVLEAQRLHRKGEKYFYAGVIIVAATLIGPFGIPPLVYGLYLLRKVEKGGLVAVRPWHVSVIGAFAIADAGANFVGWSFDTFAAQTGIGWTMLRGWGHLFDGGYFNRYGSTWIGGVVGRRREVLHLHGRLRPVAHPPGCRLGVPQDEALGLPVDGHQLVDAGALLGRLVHQRHAATSPSATAPTAAPCTGSADGGSTTRRTSSGPSS